VLVFACAAGLGACFLLELDGAFFAAFEDVFDFGACATNAEVAAFWEERTAGLRVELVAGAACEAFWPVEGAAARR
jgi:hypothetical protein